MNPTQTKELLRSVLRVSLFALMGCYASAPSAAGLTGQDIGRLIGGLIQATAPIPEETEVRFGAHMAATLLGAAPLVDDQEIQRYVNRVGRWLVLQTERPHLPWRFGVLNTETVNAFAAPGGFVFITKGLLNNLRSESELAGALAHEMGHVLRRHHLQAIQKQLQLSVVLGTAGAAVSDSATSQALFNAISGVGMQLYAKGLDREDEFQADRVGVVIATRAGYDPYGLLSVLSTLEGMSANDANASLFFSTHPKPSERIQLLDQKMTGTLDRFAGREEVMLRY